MKKIQYLIVTVIFILGTCSYCSGQTVMYDDMRMPWATSWGGFIQDWLVLGVFPNEEGKGFDTDFLSEHGGEISIKPQAGMIHQLEDGSQISWEAYYSQYNRLNFFHVLQDKDFYNKIAYAYTTINRQEPGKAFVSFGHIGGAKIWINGNLIYTSQTGGGTAAEMNHIEVDLKRGENSVLFKSAHAGWTWGIQLRIIEPQNFSLIHDSQLIPSIIESDNDELVIKTDNTLNPEIQKIDVNIKVRVAGGAVIEEKTVKRGDRIIVDTKTWPEGVFDICFKTYNNKQETETAYLYWYKGDPLKKVRELYADVPSNPTEPHELIHAMLAEMIHDRIGENLDQVGAEKLTTIYSPLMEYDELKLAAEGKKGPIRPNGFVRLAYRDEIDGTPQFCRAYLPLDYSPHIKYPLVLKLHGYNPPNPVYIHWWAVDSRHYDYADKYDIILLEPHGRGNTGYSSIGERDVLHCITMAKEQLSVDVDRIYLFGESMGGGGTWLVGSHNPELFAAIAPVFGGWDYHAFMDEERQAGLSERDRWEQERNSSFTQAEALLNTPVFVLHGDIDKSVNVNQSRFAVRMLQRWGYNIRYHEYPQFGHEGLDIRDELISWFLEHKRNTHPRKVRIRSADLKSASAHWLRVIQREDPYEFILAEAEVLTENTLRLSTKNVLEIEATLLDPLINSDEAVTVIWNVDDIRQELPKDGILRLQRKDYHPEKLVKTPEIKGPLSDVINTPFALVIGTISPDSLMVKLCHQKAQEFIEFWKDWQKYEPRVFKDTDITEQDMRRFSLILYGAGDANAVTKKMSNQIPLSVSTDKIEIDGRSFEASDAGVRMVYPHPLNPSRYIAILGATSWAGMYFLGNQYNNYDFYITDGRIPNRHKGRPADKIMLARGMFDFNWGINDRYLEIGDAELRAKSPMRKVLPDLTTIIENLPDINPQVYDTYEGSYEIAPGVLIKIYREGNRLMATSPDSKTFELYPESETEYFIDQVGVEVIFQKNNEGKISELLIHQPDRDLTAKKINM
jgi:dienelactone hydrolase